MMKKFCFALSSIFILPHIVFYLLMKSKTGGGNYNGYKTLVVNKKQRL